MTEKTIFMYEKLHAISGKRTELPSKNNIKNTFNNNNIPNMDRVNKNIYVV